MIFLIVFIVIFTIILYYLKILKYLIYLKKVPGPFPLPIIGNTLTYLVGETNIVKLLDDLMRKHTRLFKLFIASWPMLVVNDADTAKFLMSKSSVAQKAFAYSFLYNWIGFGLVTGYGDRWKQIKKLVITNVLHASNLVRYLKVHNKLSNEFNEKLSQIVDKPNFDINNYIGLYSFIITLELTFGIEMNEEECKLHLNALDTMTDVIMSRILRPWQHYEFLYKFSTNFRNEQKCMEIIRKFAMTAIEGKKKKCNNNSEDLNDRVGYAVLDLLLEAKIDGKHLSQQEIINEINSALFGGHHTNAAALNTALYLLAHHEDIQEKVYKEQVELFKDRVKENLEFSKIDVTVQDLNQMKYLDAVIKEVLRLYPPVAVLGRVVSEDTYYPSADCVLPKGLEVGMCLYHIQRDPKYNLHPDEFIPERHFDNVTYDIQKEGTNFLAFSGGIRMCLGMKYSYFQIKTTLSKVIRRFKLMPSSPHVPLKIHVSLMLKSTTGYHLRIINRTQED